MKPQKETFSATGSGNAAIPGRASWRETVPIEPVGQATSAISARRRSASTPGCRRDVGVVLRLREDRRRDPPARVAVDAGPVDVEVPGRVVGQPISD